MPPRRKRFGYVAPAPEAHRINRRIRASQVRLIAGDGHQVGVVSLEEALRHAEAAHLDLVEVAPSANPPVCRLLDYGKFKYQEHKKEAEARKKQSTMAVKELRLGYRTDTHDLQRQIEKAREFLAQGDRVKFCLRFRGREMAYQDLGRAKLMRVCDTLKEIAQIDGTPKMEGRMMGVILAPSKKKRPTTPPPAAPAASEGAAETASRHPAAAPRPPTPATR